jgi:hypothetical protein
MGRPYADVAEKISIPLPLLNNPSNAEKIAVKAAMIASRSFKRVTKDRTTMARTGSREARTVASNLPNLNIPVWE